MHRAFSAAHIVPRVIGFGSNSLCPSFVTSSDATSFESLSTAAFLTDDAATESREFFVKRSNLWTVAALCLAAAGSLIASPSVSAEAGFDVAIIEDGQSARQIPLAPLFRQELLALTEGEIEVRFKVLYGQWSQDGTLAALHQAYEDPEIDMVLVTGLAANQVVALHRDFAKPTFLPWVFDAELLGLPRAGVGSGHPNLSYLSDEMDFTDNLENFLDIVPFRRVGLLVDGYILQAASKIADRAAEIAMEHDVRVISIPYEDPEGDLAALISEDIDAVMVGGLERLSDAAVDRLVASLVSRRIPSFSFAGDRFVRRGLLTTDTSDSDWQRLARRVALNMQSVMLGEEAAEQPVDFRSKRRLYLNLKTARAIDVWPTYDVLVEAVLLGDDPGDGGLGWDLAQVAEEAVRINQDLLVQRLTTDAGALEVSLARTSLWPQISADLSVTQLDGGSPSVVAGAVAQRATTGAVTANQVLWSEPIFANQAIQEQLQLSREAELERFRLDTIQLASIAFLDILRSETQVRVQRDNLERTQANLELARDRVRVGSASRADVYRWERELATSRQSSIDAYTQRTVAREKLNRILHRPLTEPFHVAHPTLDDNYLLISEGSLRDSIDNPKTFRRLTQFQVLRGLRNSPELAALEASLTAKRRERVSLQRDFFSPTVSLQGKVSEVLEEDRVGPSMEGESDWSLGLVATLPLYSGGARRLEVEQADLETRQLEAQMVSLQEQVEQGIRANMHFANASYNNIALAEQAAEAATKNLDLITDSYSQGVVSIIELLDAQSAAVQSDEAAANAVFDFLIDLMNAQRSAGAFDFFLDATERQMTLLELQRFLATEEQDR